MVARVSQEKVELAERKGSRLRDVLIFLAGVEAFQTLALVWLIVGGLPTSVPQFASTTVTQQVILLAIVLSALITLGLLDGANALKNHPAKKPLKQMHVGYEIDSISRLFPPSWTTPERLSLGPLSGRPSPRDFYWRRRV